MYGKLFESMYDGSLSDNWQALITFQQMIILCDADGILDMTPSAISRRTGIPIDHIESGIKILEAPDPSSRTKKEDGRRIVRLDEHREWGWYLVNHKKYKSLQDSDTVREQNRIRKQRQREKEKESRFVTDCHGSSRHTDTDTDNKNTCSPIPANDYSNEFLEFWKHYPKKKAKGAAWKAWKKIKRPVETIVQIQTALLWQKKSKDWTKEGGQYIPHPSTYLNAKGWEDEPQTGTCSIKTTPDWL